MVPSRRRSLAKPSVVADHRQRVHNNPFETPRATRPNLNCHASFLNALISVRCCGNFLRRRSTQHRLHFQRRSCTLRHRRLQRWAQGRESDVEYRLTRETGHVVSEQLLYEFDLRAESSCHPNWQAQPRRRYYDQQRPLQWRSVDARCGVKK